MSTAQSGLQSAAERKVAEAEAQALIAQHANEHTKLVSAVRKSVRKRLPTAHEIVYEYRSWIVISYSPNENGYDGVLALRADADGVKFYFNRGKGLPDPEKLLKGSGGLVRFIELENAATLATPAVKKLIDEALASNAKPFEEAGKGSVIIRSVAKTKSQAKKRAKASGKESPKNDKAVRLKTKIQKQSG